MTNEIETLLHTLNLMGDHYGPFQSLLLGANGQALAVWAHRAENLTLRELQHIARTNAPAPDWSALLGRALVHKSRGELAEARALELEATDLLLTEAYKRTAV